METMTPGSSHHKANKTGLRGNLKGQIHGLKVIIDWGDLRRLPPGNMRPVWRPPRSASMKIPPTHNQGPRPGHHRIKGPLNRAGLPRWLGGAFGGHQGSAFEAAGGQESRPKEAGMAAKCQAKTPRMSGENFHSRGLIRPKRRSKMPPPVQAAGLGRGGGGWASG